jgi:hypothetical protein
MTRLPDYSLTEIWKLTWPYSVLVIAFALIRTYYPENWWIAELVHHLADACVVAGVLAIFVELGAANKLIHRVGDDLAEKLVGRGLPRALQKQIQGIVRTSGVRDDFVKTYRIYNEPNNQVRLDISISYNVKNYSDHPIAYTPELGEEIFYRPEFLSLECRLSETDGYAFTEDELKSMITESPWTKGKSVAGKPVTIPPFKSDESSNSCCVRWQYRIYMPEDYSDILSFGAPTLGVELQLLEKPNDLEFTAGGKDVHHLPGSKSWTSTAPFIHGQHVRAWWFRKGTKPINPFD